MDSTTSDQHATRRLAAVMFTDMVGYSSLVQRDERLGLALLAEQRDIVRGILPRYGGREVDTAGDAFFVEFGSALEAAECAVEIQRTLHDRNEREPTTRHIVLRIGLHLGDVVHVGEQVQGDGVNIAARMEPLARPGSICVSEDVARQIHNKLDLPLAPLGSRQLKNIRLPMEAFRIVMPWEDDFAAVRPFHEFKGREPRLIDSERWKVAMIAVVGVVLAVFGWLAINRIFNETIDADVHTSSSLLAVLPFTVQGSPEFEYLGKGMVDLLSTKLDGAGALRTVDPRAILGLVAQTGHDVLDPTGANRIARSLGAGAFVLGNIVEVGGKLRIDATVYSGEAERRTQHGTVEGTAGEIFGLLDQLAVQLLVEDAGPGASLESLETMTTSSFDALKHYLQGVSAFRSARFQAANDELAQAVEVDSTFALAWYQLSATADWLYDPVRALDAARAATRHSSRLSARGRRLVEALDAAKSGRNDEAFRLYREILSSYPDDVEAWYQLGEVIFHAGPTFGVGPEESLEAWERLLFFEPDQITALIHMARVWQLKGELARVDSIAKIIFDLEPGAERNVELRTHVAFNRGDESAIRKVVETLKAGSDDTISEVLWSLASFREDMHAAMVVSSIMTDPTRSAEARGMGYVAQAYLMAAAGRFEAADSAFDRASSIGHLETAAHRYYVALLPFRTPSNTKLAATVRGIERWRTDNIPPSPKSSGWASVHNGVHAQLREYLLGIAQSVRGNYSAADEMASHLEKTTRPRRTGSIFADMALGIRGAMEISRGDPEEAESLLKAIRRHTSYQYAVSSPFFSLPRERFIEGQLYEDRSAFDEAIAAMSAFDGHSLYDKVFVAPSHLRRAAVYRKLGNREEERRHLSKFVELWKDCDDEVAPMLHDARARLSELSE